MRIIGEKINGTRQSVAQALEECNGAFIQEMYLANQGHKEKPLRGGNYRLTCSNGPGKGANSNP